MGCFSFICAECGEPVNSTSLNGEYVHLFLLDDGFPREHMYGKYDSYGRVFKDNGCSDSYQWDLDWSEVCDLMSSRNPRNGIGAVHGKCFSGAENVPHVRSEDDPDQGWGKLDKECMESDIDPFHVSNYIDPTEEGKGEETEVWYNDDD